MDSLTHFCLGFCSSRASGIASDRPSAITAGVVALLPDLDVFVIPLLDPVERFAFHRGPSHAIAFGLGMACLLAWPIARIRSLPLLQAGGLVALAWIGHSCLDALTGYGTALWWPFSDRRFSLELLFVVDPLVTIPLLLVVTIECFGQGWRRFGRQAGRVAATGVLALITLYIGLGAWGKARCEEDFRQYLTESLDLPIRRIHVEPTPLNNQLWYLCAETPDRYISLYRSVWDGDVWERLRSTPRRQEPLLRHADRPLVAAMLNLFRGWFTCLPTKTEDEALAVVDMRLGHRYGWQDQQAAFEFLYRIGLLDQAQLSWHLQRPQTSWNLDRLALLLDRIDGLTRGEGMPP